jgi:hypothetical protein
MATHIFHVFSHLRVSRDTITKRYIYLKTHVSSIPYSTETQLERDVSLAKLPSCQAFLLIVQLRLFVQLRLVV